MYVGQGSSSLARRGFRSVRAGARAPAWRAGASGRASGRPPAWCRASATGSGSGRRRWRCRAAGAARRRRRRRCASGTAPSSAARVVIMIGRKRSSAGAVDRLARRSCPSRARASRAKSIIMIAFFLTMPISRITPISAMMRELGVEQQQRQQRAHARRRQRRQDGQRMHVALVEDAEHDVDGDQRGQDQAGLALQRVLERSAPPWKVACAASRARRCSAIACRMASVACDSETPSAQVERDRGRRRTGPGG